MGWVDIWKVPFLSSIYREMTAVMAAAAAAAYDGVL